MRISTSKLLTAHQKCSIIFRRIGQLFFKCKLNLINGKYVKKFNNILDILYNYVIISKIQN